MAGKGRGQAEEELEVCHHHRWHPLLLEVARKTEEFAITIPTLLKLACNYWSRLTSNPPAKDWLQVRRWIQQQNLMNYKGQKDHACGRSKNKAKQIGLQCLGCRSPYKIRLHLRETLLIAHPLNSLATPSIKASHRPTVFSLFSCAINVPVL